MEVCECGRHYVAKPYAGIGRKPRCPNCKRPMSYYIEEGKKL